MTDTMTFGTAPSDEDCVQLISNDGGESASLMKAEAARYVELLYGVFPEAATCNCAFRVKRESHDFGTYYETAISFNDDDPDALNYALFVESNLPATWDDRKERLFESYRTYDGKLCEESGLDRSMLILPVYPKNYRMDVRDTLKDAEENLAQKGCELKVLKNTDETEAVIACIDIETGTEALKRYKLYNNTGETRKLEEQFASRGRKKIQNCDVECYERNGYAQAEDMPSLSSPDLWAIGIACQSFKEDHEAQYALDKVLDRMGKALCKPFMTDVKVKAAAFYDNRKSYTSRRYALGAIAIQLDSPNAVKVIKTLKETAF